MGARASLESQNRELKWERAFLQEVEVRREVRVTEEGRKLAARKVEVDRAGQRALSVAAWDELVRRIGKSVAAALCTEVRNKVWWGSDA